MRNHGDGIRIPLREGSHQIDGIGWSKGSLSKVNNKGYVCSSWNSRTRTVGIVTETTRCNYRVRAHGNDLITTAFPVGVAVFVETRFEREIARIHIAVSNGPNAITIRVRHGLAAPTVDRARK